jgi:RNA polymerase sigma-70 factor (ECF subfamily)
MRPDEELVREVLQAPQGDTAAFAELVRRHQGRVLANCRHLTRSPDDAEDLAQEVFVKVFFRLSSFEERARFATWLQRVKVNHCLNHLKSRRGRIALDLDDEAVAGDPALQVPAAAPLDLERGEERARVRAVLDSLPDSLRIPLVLCDLDGLSYREIQDQLGIGLSAVKMRIARGREEFRRRYAAVEARALAPGGRTA